MPGPHHWKRAPADNGSADPNADVRPSRPAKTVLGAIRGLMATAAAARDDGIGELVATLGTGNVYAVASNEGLIDIATGINGVPAAITAPFLLRLAFDTTLAGSAANAPHLKVDNFDCGPILRGDGTALKDGDLVQGRIVTALGDMAAPTDTKVTRVRVLEITPGELQDLISAALAANGSGVTTYSASGATTLSNNQYVPVSVIGSDTDDFTVVGGNCGIKIKKSGRFIIKWQSFATITTNNAAPKSIGVAVMKNGTAIAYGGDSDTATGPGNWSSSAFGLDVVRLAVDDVLIPSVAISVGNGALVNAQTTSGTLYLARI